MQTTLLAIDDISLPFRKNVCLYLSKPAVRREPVLAPSPLGSGAPDDAAAHFYGTVLHDEGRFRLWYYAAHQGKNPDWPPRMMQQIARKAPWAPADYDGYPGPICYAESDDGIHWTKPALGQVLFKGSRANNALAIPHVLIGAVNVIKDTADPDPARRYKMVYEYFPDQSDPIIEEYGCRPTIALAVSPDGLRWTVTAIPFRDQFVEQSSFIKHSGQYIVHYQVMDDWAGWFSEGGSKCGRTGVARVSCDWDLWPDLVAEAFALPEPEDRTRRGMNGDYDQVHIGVGAASFGNICIGVYGLWHNADNTRSFDQISGDLGLLVSNDGVHFREPVKGHRFLRREDSLARPVPGYNFNTVLCQGNGILNVGDETRIYHGRWRNAGAYATGDELKYSSGEVALATLPRDRWGGLGLNPGASEGTICSAALTLPAAGCELRINADGIAGLAVDLVDEQFRPIAGFLGGKVCGADGLDCPVAWKERALGELAGQRVRVQVRLQRVSENLPRVYALALA